MLVICHQCFMTVFWWHILYCYGRWALGLTSHGGDWIHLVTGKVADTEESSQMSCWGPNLGIRVFHDSFLVTRPYRLDTRNAYCMKQEEWMDNPRDQILERLWSSWSVWKSDWGILGSQGHSIAKSFSSSRCSSGGTGGVQVVGTASSMIMILRMGICDMW